MLWILSAVALWFGLHWAYAALMAAKSAINADRLTLYWKVILLPLAALGLLLDFVFQFTFGWLMFLETPFRGGLLFSGRVQHHYRHSSGWRVDLAEFWARQLNILDKDHIR